MWPTASPLIQSVAPAEFLTRIDVDDDVQCGLREISLYDGLGRIGATTVTGNGGDWMLAVEYNGFLGVRADLMRPVSASTTMVSHYKNVNGVDRFCWYVDGDLRLNFQPFTAAWRTGSTPDELLADMDDIGFPLSDDLEDRDDEDGEEWQRIMQAYREAFALAERLTGVRLTPEILGESTCLCGPVAV